MESAVSVTSSAGLDLLKEALNTTGKDDNVFISGFNIMVALSALMQGTRGVSRDEIEGFMKIQGSSAEFLDSFHKLAESLESSAFSSGSRLFYQAGLQLLDSCPLRDSSAVLDFRREPDAAKDAVNEWVHGRTRGGIPHFLDSPLTPDTILFLASAAHFKADWKHPFEAEHTYPGTWNASEEETYQCDMMIMTVPRGSTNVRVFNSDAHHYRLLSLPYEEDFAFVVLTPFVIGDLANIEKNLRAEELAEDFKKAEPAQGAEIHMPKFKMSFDADLEKMLKNLGIRSIFEAKSADFRGMLEHADNVCVSKAVHKAVVDVDEKGTVAAAATGFGIVMMCAMIPQMITVNSPSLFFILHAPSATPLFGGRLAKPPATTKQ